ncbi:hypothetical protein PR048_026536 [Dryococelus australis]|uniref:Uncharacterized protein n=1 Tax=Dryococelus australis TaxID=614101 RepID=A0ABQ9GLM3_9NEOP|nr:hypothetical protein PR048_026536 [Dryococelus australis]
MKEVLPMLHEQHPVVSWPRMDLAIETLVKQGVPCQMPDPKTKKKDVWCGQPIVGEGSKTDASMVEDYGTWVEVEFMSLTAAARTIDSLRSKFAAYGLQETLFWSGEFKTYCTSKAINLKLTLPFPPQSNGAVQSFNTLKIRAVGTIFLLQENKFWCKVYEEREICGYQDIKFRFCYAIHLQQIQLRIQSTRAGASPGTDFRSLHDLSETSTDQRFWWGGRKGSGVSGRLSQPLPGGMTGETYRQGWHDSVNQDSVRCGLKHSRWCPTLAPVDTLSLPSSLLHQRNEASLHSLLLRGEVEGKEI